MVATKKALVNISLTHFQSTTSHVCLANSFDLLYAILLAQLVKSIVNLIKQVYKLLATVCLHNKVKTFDINEDDCHLSLSLREVFLAFLDSRSD